MWWGFRESQKDILCQIVHNVWSTSQTSAPHVHFQLSHFLCPESSPLSRHPLHSPLHPHAGKAPIFVAVCARLTSAALRLTSPGNVCPPALFHFGSSSAITVFGSSPALSRLRRVEDCTFAPPTLNAQETRAPYWFAFKTTAEVVRRVIVC